MEVKKTEEILYTTAGDHTYIFDKGFPAIIEVYTLGGGGGGQGGHIEVWATFIKLCGDGVGGGGGGGGASYMKLSVEESASFEIKVGSGGEGGNPSNDSKDQLYWNSGESGNDGGATSVTWAAKGINLTANGGVRGGHNRTGAGSNNSGGGPGGGAGASPTNALVLDWISANGSSGGNGEDRSCDGGGGGRAATITGIGSIDSFGGNDSRGNGGNGGCHTNKGSSGLPGQVLIVATWYE